MRSNITKLYLVNLLTGIVFWYPIEKLFMRTIGIDSFGVGVNAVAFLIITLLFDVPAGVLADHWKRKYTLLLAVMMMAASSLIGGLSHSLVPYLLASCAFGLYLVLTTGTFQAIMYDSLKEIGEQQSYDRHQGLSYALFLAGVSVSSLAGGYISAWWGYRAAYFLTIIFIGLAILVLLSVHEPSRNQPLDNRQYFRHMAKGFRALHTTPLVLQLALFLLIASLLRNSQNEYAGLYYIALGLSVIPTGYANAGKWLAFSLGQLFGQRVGRNILRFTPLLFVLFTAFTVINTRWGMVFFFATALMYGMLHNQTEAELQNHISSDIRATALSCLTFSTNVVLVPLSLLFGWLAVRFSVFISYQMIAAIGLLYIISWLLYGRRQLQSVFDHTSPLASINSADDLPGIK